jgi:hypothetical protein
LTNAKKAIESLFADGRGITQEKQATLEGIVESGGDAFVVVEKPAPEGNWPCTKSGYAEVRKGSATQKLALFFGRQTHRGMAAADPAGPCDARRCSAGYYAMLCRADGEINRHFAC